MIFSLEGRADGFVSMAVGGASLALLSVLCFTYVTSYNPFELALGFSRPVGRVLAVGHALAIVSIWAVVFHDVVRSWSRAVFVGLLSLGPALVMMSRSARWDVVELFRFSVAPKAWWVLLLLGGVAILRVVFVQSVDGSSQIKYWAWGGLVSFCVGMLVHVFGDGTASAIMLQVLMVLLVPALVLIVLSMRKSVHVLVRFGCVVLACFLLAVATVA